MKTALVTGASGFIGGALALRLAQDGVRVRALVRSPQKADFLRGQPSIDIVTGDVTDADSLRRAAEGCEQIFHLAAAFGDRATQQAVNVEGTRNVFEAAADSGARRVVLVSSIAAYGYQIDGEVTEATPLTTDSHDPYAVTKAEGERVARAVSERRGIEYSIIRPGMVYGPRSEVWTGRLFQLAKRRPTPFPGRGTGTAYPIFIDDVVAMMVILAQHPAASGEAFHCTPDPSVTWREFIGAYQRLAGHNRWLAFPPVVAELGARVVAALAPGASGTKDAYHMVRYMQRRITFRMDKARERLGWQPAVDLETGVARCAPWLREQGLLA